MNIRELYNVLVKHGNMYLTDIPEDILLEYRTSGMTRRRKMMRQLGINSISSELWPNIVRRIPYIVENLLFSKVVTKSIYNYSNNNTAPIYYVVFFDLYNSKVITKDQYTEFLNLIPVNEKVDLLPCSNTRDKILQENVISESLSSEIIDILYDTYYDEILREIIRRKDNNTLYYLLSKKVKIPSIVENITDNYYLAPIQYFVKLRGNIDDMFLTAARKGINLDLVIKAESSITGKTLDEMFDSYMMYPIGLDTYYIIDSYLNAGVSIDTLKKHKDNSYIRELIENYSEDV